MTVEAAEVIAQAVTSVGGMLTVVAIMWIILR